MPSLTSQKVNFLLKAVPVCSCHLIQEVSMLAWTLSCFLSFVNERLLLKLMTLGMSNGWPPFSRWKHRWARFRLLFPFTSTLSHHFNLSSIEPLLHLLTHCYDSPDSFHHLSSIENEHNKRAVTNVEHSVMPPGLPRKADFRLPLTKCFHTH